MEECFIHSPLSISVERVTVAVPLIRLALTISRHTFAISPSETLPGTSRLTSGTVEKFRCLQ